ncbi:MAG: hypothetical protein GY928_25060 [Colwellia sp.]|nr:hypothetical protein [Colwellia sp.]
MVQKLESGFLQIPKDVLTLTKVNSKPFGFAEKSVYSYLLTWSKNKEEVFPSMKRMCTDLGVGSRTSMIKYVKKLELMNLLDVVRTEGKASRYYILGLDGKEVSFPKESSLMQGTNSDTRREDKLQKVPPVKVTSPALPIVNTFTNYEEDEMDDDWIPF